MPSAVVCAGCGAGLAVPPAAAGKALRCPCCGAVNSIPGAEPPRERVRAERARRAPDRDDDDDPPPRRRRSGGGVPGWVWGVGGGVLALAAVIVVGLALARRDRELDIVQPPGTPSREELAKMGFLPEAWERRTDAEAGATWEFPHTGQTTARSAAVRFQDQSALGFDLTITDVAERRRSVPLYNPLAELRSATVGGHTSFGKVEQVGTLDGRPAVVARSQIILTLAVADAERLYEFRVTHPQRDDGEKRAKRFFDSARITRPLPPESGPAPPPGKAGADAGEAVPPGWDRVLVPRSRVTVLMPQGPTTRPFAGGAYAGLAPVARAWYDAAGEERVVTACSVDAAGGPSAADPFAAAQPKQVLTAAGRPARLNHGEIGGLNFVHLALDAGDGKTVAVGLTGRRLDPADPEVRRVLDSVSLTLPAQKGPPAVGTTVAPPWTRRHAPGGLSVEMPGPGGPANEAGVALGPAVSWTSRGRIPLPDRKEIDFVVTATGIAAGGGSNPWTAVADEYARLGRTPATAQPVRRAEVGGRPGYVSVRPGRTTSTVQMKVQDVVMTYLLTASGPGLTPDHPDVVRFLGSATFDAGAASAAPRWERRRLDGSGFSAEMPPPPPSAKTAAPPKAKLGEAVARVEYGQLSDGKGGVLTFTAGYVGTARATDPGPPPDLTPGHALVGKLIDEAKARPDTHRHVITTMVQDRPAARVVTGEKAGGAVAVRLYLGEGDRLYTLQVEGRGITENTPEVQRFFGTVEFADGKK